ncbi:phage integrase central domain-containing protein [Sphingopyxis terrae subsp. ummariensis]
MAAHAQKNCWCRGLLDHDIGGTPVATITPALLLHPIKRVERGGHHEPAQRLQAFASRVLRYACTTVRAEYNPTDVLLGAFVTPERRHRAAILDPKGVVLQGAAAKEPQKRSEERRNPSHHRPRRVARNHGAAPMVGALAGG